MCVTVRVPMPISKPGAVPRQIFIKECREESGLKSAECDNDFQLLDRQNENFFQAWDINTGSIVKFFKDSDLLLLEITVGHSIQHAMNLAIGFRRPNTRSNVTNSSAPLTSPQTAITQSSELVQTPPPAVVPAPVAPTPVVAAPVPAQSGHPAYAIPEIRGIIFQKVESLHGI